MIITKIAGEELEKSKSNSPEDFFNRSEVTFESKGEKTLTVLYLRFFDEKVSEFTPYDSESLFEVDGRVVHLRDVVALLALQAHPEYADRHRVYINDEEQFAGLFAEFEQESFETMVKKVITDNRLELNRTK